MKKLLSFINGPLADRSLFLTETGGVSGADAIWPFEKGSAINIHVYCATPEEAKKAFSILAQEGETIGE